LFRHLGPTRRASLGAARAVGAGLFAASLLLATAAQASATAPAEPDSSPTETLADVLAAAASEGSATAEEFARAAPVTADGPGSPILDEQGRISATVFWNGQSEAILDRLGEALGSDGVLESVSTLAPAASVWVDPALLGELSEVPGITGVTPNLRPVSSAVPLGDRLASVRDSLPGTLEIRARDGGGALRQSPGAQGDACRSIPVEADAPLRSDLARSEFGADGTGVIIGIVSDSFASLVAPTSWADDVAAGALPGPGNPCGRTEPVTVVSDAVGGSDEGRAMAQLVHGIAPGATLLFADSGVSDVAMAENIAKLIDAGADIIVDDISWFQEPYFQQGIISAVYEQARAEHGVLAVSSAGNSTATASRGPHLGAPLSSWQTTAYRPMECPEWIAVGPQDPLYERSDIDCLDFDPGAGEQPYDLLTMGGEAGSPERVLNVTASIAEPMYGVTTSYELRFYEEDAAGDPQPLDRVTMVGAPYPGLVGGIEVKPATTVRMVFVRVSYDAAASAAPAVFIGFPMGATAIAERQFMGGAGDRVGSVTLGHNGDGSALSVAAVPWNDPTQLRPFSSLGPNTLLFERVAVGDPAPAPAQRLPQAATVLSPQIAAVDGTRTTFFGEPEDGPTGPEYRFAGTSAAAPHLAAVAALGLSYAPGASSDELRAALLATARGTADAGPVNPYDPGLFPDAVVFGAGLVDARAMLAALPAPDPGDGSGDSGGSGGSGDSGGSGSPNGPQPSLGAGDSPSGRLLATGGPELGLGVLVAGLLAVGAGTAFAGWALRRGRERRTRADARGPLL